jgi:hypothetical protein
MARQRTKSASQRSARANRRRGAHTRSLLASDMGAPAPHLAGAESAAAPRRTRVKHVVQTLSREQEYAFIRADLRRLLITAGLVTIVMLAMLAVFD